MGIEHELLLQFLEKMILIRKFEYAVISLAERGIAIGSIHPCIVEEATAVGTCLAIDSYDYFFPNHRGHGQELTIQSLDFIASICSHIPNQNEQTVPLEEACPF